MRHTTMHFRAYPLQALGLGTFRAKLWNRSTQINFFTRKYYLPPTLSLNLFPIQLSYVSIFSLMDKPISLLGKHICQQTTMF